MRTPLIVVALLPSLAVAAPPAPQTGGGMFRWQQYELALPSSGWKVVEDTLDPKGNKALVLQPAGEESPVLMLTLFSKQNATAPDQQALDMPAGAAVAMGMPLARKMAGAEGDRALAISYGCVDLPEGMTPEAHFTIGASAAEFRTLDSIFVTRRTGGFMFAALVMTRGTRGQVSQSDLGGEHYRHITEAYSILKSIRVSTR